MWDVRALCVCAYVCPRVRLHLELAAFRKGVAELEKKRRKQCLLAKRTPQRPAKQPPCNTDSGLGGGGAPLSFADSDALPHKKSDFQDFAS